MTTYDEFVRKNAEGRWDRELRDRERGRSGMEQAIERFTADPAKLDGFPFALLPTAVLAWGPQKIAPLAARLAPLLGPAMAANATLEHRSTRVLGIGTLANLLACCGLPDETAPVAEWLREIETSKDEESSAQHWNRAFAALALDQQELYRALGGADPKKPLPVTPPAAFGGNLQGLLRHLGGAVENGAGWPAVERAWRDLVANLERHEDARSIDRDTPFWIARIVHHRIAGAPLGEVAQWLHTEIQR